jgi:NTE family protein
MNCHKFIFKKTGSTMKIGIAFSGGGLKGIAHLGVMQALIEMKIDIKAISGCSAGAIVGAFIAKGYEPLEILAIIKGIKIQNLLKPSTLKGGMLKLNILNEKILAYIPEDSFESLKLPLNINATDIINGKVVNFNQGQLSIPLLASCSVPGIFEPIKYQNRVLIDGGVLNNLPIEPLIEQNCDFIIGSHCNPLKEINSASPNIRRLLSRSMFLAIHKNTVDKIPLCDVFIEPPQLASIKRYSFLKMNEIYKMGYETTKEKESEINQKIEFLQNKYMNNLLSKQNKYN